VQRQRWRALYQRWGLVQSVRKSSERSTNLEEKVTQEVTEPIEAAPKTEEPEVTTTVTEEKVIFEDKVNLERITQIQVGA